MNLYVAAFKKRRADKHPMHYRAEVVEARTPGEAAEAALEGEKYERDDGVFVVNVAELEKLETFTVERRTETAITTLEKPA